MGALYFSAVPPWCIMTHHSGSAVSNTLICLFKYSVLRTLLEDLYRVPCPLYGYRHRYGMVADNSELESLVNYDVRLNHCRWLGETIKKEAQLPRSMGPKILHNGKPVWVWCSSSTPYLHTKLKRGQSAAGIWFGR